MDLASYALGGEKAGDLGPGQKALLQQWFADRGWCDPVESEDDAGCRIRNKQALPRRGSQRPCQRYARPWRFRGQKFGSIPGSLADG